MSKGTMRKNLSSAFNKIFKTSGCRNIVAYRYGTLPKRYERAFTGTKSTIWPDVAVYPQPELIGTSGRAKEGCETPPRGSPTSISTPCRAPPTELVVDGLSGEPPSNHHTAWSLAEACISVHTALVLSSKGGSTQVPSWVADYASLIFSHQHRVFFFVVSICGSSARFFRFDRAGAISSEPFDLYNDPTAILGRFVHRFSKMSREQRGHDPTASLASSSEAALFRQLHTHFSEDSAINPTVLRGLKTAATPGWLIYALDVYAPWSPKHTFLDAGTTAACTSHRCLVGRPSYISDRLYESGTRGFVAYDLTEGTVVWIKDSWRPLSADVPSEFDNYQTLLRKMTPDVLDEGLLTLRAGGDVLWPPSSCFPDHAAHSEAGARSESWFGSQTPQTQTTLTHDYAPGAEDSTPHFPRRHARLVFEEVCRTLEEFDDARELMLAVSIAIMVHRDAWENAELLHRNISVGNILIYEDPTDPMGRKFILADWRLATAKDKLAPTVDITWNMTHILERAPGTSSQRWCNYAQTSRMSCRTT
ncbi:uncharacterized protein TRAVEDRAFT_23623 [Trametes versicolor FP-101664 SS1]|uniref:uncharacterized protein n=1 Tax=Trametes versicolor (strain FP-101664) TaxID=717944 RepID=UPI00046239B1|nr:uncharacterized protein TRAVEDRAFT_23623 [Trametes versicolor FP-101664 SS1]EIW53189.1 hypothetical protein TRAVEDRAFT_23623 [Trametes versicolor FP-101664 SS1]